MVRQVGGDQLGTEPIPKSMRGTDPHDFARSESSARMSVRAGEDVERPRMVRRRRVPPPCYGNRLPGWRPCARVCAPLFAAAFISLSRCLIPAIMQPSCTRRQWNRLKDSPDTARCVTPWQTLPSPTYRQAEGHFGLESSSESVSPLRWRFTMTGLPTMRRSTSVVGLRKLDGGQQVPELPTSHIRMLRRSFGIELPATPKRAGEAVHSAGALIPCVADSVFGEKLSFTLARRRAALPRSQIGVARDKCLVIRPSKAAIHPCGNTTRGGRCSPHQGEHHEPPE